MSDERNLDSLLKQMAEGHHPQLPSPELIWWRAQILRKQREKERIERPLVIMRWLAAAVCGAAFAVLLASHWTQLQAAAGDGNRWLLALGVIVISASLAFLPFWAPSSNR